MSRSFITKDNHDVIRDWARETFQRATQTRANSGNERRILQSPGFIKGEYAMEEMAEFGADAPYLNIIERKSWAFEALFTDLQFNVMEKPWALKAPAVKKLPHSISRFLAVRLLNMFGPGFTEGPETPEKTYFILKEAQKLGMRMKEKEAAEIAKNAERLVSSTMMEAGWTAAYEDIIQDVARYPNGILKGPYIRAERELTYQENEVVESSVLKARFKRISPVDFYPASDATDTQNGRHVSELLHLTPDFYYQASRIKGFYKPGIKLALEKMDERKDVDWTKGDTGKWWGGCVSEPYTLAFENPHLWDSDFGVEMFHTVSGKFAKQELNIKRGLSDDEVYQFHTIMGQDQMLYGQFNDYPNQWRHYHTASYRTSNDDFWGRSPVDLLRQLQVTSNALFRAHQRNAAMQSEPIYEEDRTRISKADQARGIWPGMRIGVRPDPLRSDRKAINMYHIPSNTEALRAAMLDLYKLADDASGLPSFVTDQPSGSIGRTSTVYVNAYNNALKGIRKVGQNIDKGIVEPAVKMMYDLVQAYSNDVTVKYHLEVEVSGIAGLVEKELAGSNDEFLLQTIGSATDSGHLDPAVMQRFLGNYFRKLGVDMPELPDPDRDEALSGLQGVGETGIPSAPSFGTVPETAQAGTPLPELDGRSPQISNQRTPQ